MNESDERLAVRDVSVSFGGVRALTDVSLSVTSERVHGIIGPNGSGKTTLLNALSGFVRVSGGIYLDGHEITRMAPHRRAAGGLGRTFQNPRGDHTLSVRQMLRLGEHLRRVQPWWMVALAPTVADRAWAQSDARAREFVRRAGLDESILNSRLTDLSAGVMKMIDIGRALLGRPRVLLLDEPTSGMNESEIARLRTILEELRTEGATVVLVEHNLRFVSMTCDVVTALSGGRVMTEGSLETVLGNKEVVEAYLGGASAMPDESGGMVRSRYEKGDTQVGRTSTGSEEEVKGGGDESAVGA